MREIDGKVNETENTLEKSKRYIMAPKLSRDKLNT